MGHDGRAAVRGWVGRAVRRLGALDRAVFAAVSGTDTPDLDRALARLSRAADHGRLWLATGGALALTGPRGRRAAVDGLAALGLASAVANLVAKPLGRRRRPDASGVAVGRQVRMPRSRSFPSGHTASAFAFTTGVATAWPAAGALVRPLAAAVGYSRVHTGVHYPGDVLGGALLGRVLAPVAVAALDRLRALRSPGD